MALNSSLTINPGALNFNKRRLKVLKSKKGDNWHTKQYCKACGKTIKIDALNFLMNLDKPVICDKCKKKEVKP